MSESKDKDQPMVQYFSEMQNYLKQMMSDPEALKEVFAPMQEILNNPKVFEDMLSPMMEMQKKNIFPGEGENSKSNLINGSNDALENKGSDSHADIHEKMRRVIKGLRKITEKESGNQQFEYHEEIKKAIKTLIKIKHSLFPKDSA